MNPGMTYAIRSPKFLLLTMSTRSSGSEQATRGSARGARADPLVSADTRSGSSKPDTEIGSMARKAQHHDEYAPVPPLLRQLRDDAAITQRELASRLRRPQSWVHNCETGDRRVDLAEFVSWARACGRSPRVAVERYLRLLGSDAAE